MSLPCRLLAFLSDITLHQRLSSADVPTFHLSLLQPSFLFIALWNAAKHKDMGDRLLLLFAVTYTKPIFSLLLLVSQTGFDTWHPTACLSPTYLGKPMLPGDVLVIVLVSLPLGWVGNTKHASLEVLQELLNVKAALPDWCACRGWPRLCCMVRRGETRACGLHRAVQYGVFFMQWRVVCVNKTESCLSSYSYLRIGGGETSWLKWSELFSSLAGKYQLL